MKRTSKKVQEFKFETVRETLVAYREHVISEINRAFKFTKFDLKEMMSGFMAFCEENEPEYLTCIHEAAIMRKMLTNRIERFYTTVKDSLHTNHEAVEDFNDQRRAAAFASHSSTSRD